MLALLTTTAMISPILPVLMTSSWTDTTSLVNVFLVTNLLNQILEQVKMKIRFKLSYLRHLSIKVWLRAVLHLPRRIKQPCLDVLEDSN